ncbi:MAG: magnesium transporter, partial [Eubacterium sp.]|nr:magnesium transporter [Eubacterium sp.]
LEDNDNEIFEDDDLRYLSNFKDKVKRLREDIDMLRSSVSHLQDAYSSYLDLKTNHIMGVFTAVTTIFFPLTLIVGWYGMNFENMPELSWRFGYLFVIIVSILVVSVLTIIMKKRKWL